MSGPCIIFLEIQSELSHKPVRIIKKWELEGIWYTFFGKNT